MTERTSPSAGDGWDDEGYEFDNVLDGDAPSGPAAAAVALFEGAGTPQPVAFNAAEVDVQVKTAKAYPRHLRSVLDQACSMATINRDMAEQCMYTYSRGGNNITGPSIRLAEIMACAWGNLRCETLVGDAGKKHVEAVATVWDLENNVLQRASVKRSIVDKYGKRYNADMIVVTSNAAASIALRNAVFKVVPRAVVQTAYNAARCVAVGNLKSLAERRQRALATFAKMGVSEDRLLARLEIDDPMDMTLDHLEVLMGIHTKLRSGDVMVEDEFPETRPTKPKKGTKK